MFKYTPLTFSGFADGYNKDLRSTLLSLDTSSTGPLSRLVDWIRVMEPSHTLWLLGNGGSASLASHMATDLQLAGVRAVALADIAATTTYANDDGWVNSYHSQVARLVRRGDVVIVVSGSGNSENVVRGAAAAYGLGAYVAAFTGMDGGILRKILLNLGDQSRVLVNHVDHPHMGVIQDCHQAMLHMVAYWLMTRNTKGGK